MEHLNEACWEGYKQVGMKEVKGRMVPNCVPVEEGFTDDVKDLFKRGFIKRFIKQPETPKSNFEDMSDEERRKYMADKAESGAPHVELRLIAKHGKGALGQQARYAMRRPLEEETDEYCPRCMMEVLMGQHPEQLGEAQYQGRTVQLGKPMRGDVKKFKVFVKDPKTGNVKKVNFGDKTMKIKKSNPARRKSFRARHRCDTNPGPRTKARYWSCRKW